MTLNTISLPNKTSNGVFPHSKTQMKALVYHGPGEIDYEEVEKPGIRKETDAIVQIVKTTICGTDLGILHGKTSSVKPGTTLGHEGVGIITETGSAVTHLKVGDLVIISCITSCGTCDYCKKQLYGHCIDGGWILGNLINGTQAEYVRIPHADTSLYLAPKDVSEDALVMLSDILPTGHEIGVINGCVKPGDTIAIVGAGPIGMAALLTAQFYSPAKIYMIDLDENRLKMAIEMGATHGINTGIEDAIQRIKDETPDGVDVAIEAVGVPATFNICQQIVRPGGHVANVGVHGKPVSLEIQDLWIKNITITMGLVNTNTTPMLLKTLVSGKIKPEQLITHHFKLDEILKAYEVFENASKSKVLKIILSN
ncbi:alcohol dehydrogenase [Leeuwenhoekiella aestuarii]|uniref:Alcohol dehydrogenase n=1 Tax=Leeuwenhoekiella aestuarii TaxID=2249426 RepID=A0A4Q0NVG3_9FLAO|nr:zinc-dependent alcohol dehydrogenase family protein [Leeuwenhoekiella aestuarii]RXG11670.1 alcohol dehydrogenase [Leeuwenhoekiella aestuarii]RXG15119.1 alcohol dehydrogenase [Leeuwenhoekiella aestuarii]